MSEHVSLPITSEKKHPSLTLTKKKREPSMPLSLLEKQLVEVERELSDVAKTAVRTYAKNVIKHHETRADEQQQKYREETSTILTQLHALTKKVQSLADNISLQRSNLELERTVLQLIQAELNK